MVALAIVLDVAFHSGGETVVNAAELAERTGMARRTLEPLLQALSRERLLDSTRGPHGEFDAVLLAQAESLTIEDLLKRAAKAGLRKPVTDPLNFVI